MTVLAIEPEPIDHRWARISGRAPVLAATCHHYLDQIAVSLRPASVAGADVTLRLFASWLVDHHPDVHALRQVQRRHIEGYKRWLATREGPTGQPLKKTTISLRLGMLRVIIERLIEWDHPDSPARNPIFGTDLPRLDEPLPRFLDDDQAARFMAAATRLDPFRRLVIEMLARTGLRVGEFCALQADAIVELGQTHWLRSRSASSTPTATSPSTPSCSTSTPPGGLGPGPTTPHCSSPTTADRSTATAWLASSTGAAASPASATSTPTSCATPWLPRPSTGA